MHVVAIGAHPDDIELGVGGTIGYHTDRGHSVTFIIATNGTAGGGKEAIRKREAREAAERLEVEDVRFLNYPDTKLEVSGDVVGSIESHVEDIEPEAVYVHAEEDTHQDHRKCALASIAATRRCPNVFGYEVYSTRSSFTPQYFVTFPERILDRKLDAIQSHASQMEKTYMDEETMRGLARFRGSQANARYAESFRVIRSVDRFDSDTRSDSRTRP